MRPSPPAARRTTGATAASALVAALLVLVVAARAQGDPPAPGFKPPRLASFVEADVVPPLGGRAAVDVILELEVDDRGRVASAKVIGSGGEAFDGAAVAAARRFVFHPGEAGGKPVPARVTYRYRFAEKLGGSAAPTGDRPVSLAGRVLHRGDRLPLQGVEIVLDEGARSATTDAEGRFAFPEIASGRHVVHLRGPILPADLDLTLKPGARTDVTWYVERRERYQTIVRARRVVQETVEQILTAEEVRRIPGTMGDTLKAVQNLPGVARPPFGGGLLVVWGSAPEDTRTYVDGVHIPTLYHFAGLRSTVGSEMIQSLTFKPGGYGVEYGRGLGGAIEIESRRPRSDGYHGFAQIDVIDISAMVEGPIRKNLTFGVAARVSWLELFLPAFITSDVQASPRYWDYQARLHWKAGARDDVDLFVFGSDDALHLILKDPNPSLTLTFQYHIYYHRGVVRWTHRFAGGATTTVTASLGYDMPFNLGSDVGTLPFYVRTGQWGYSLRAVARIPVADFLRVDAGVDFEGTAYTLDARQNIGGMLREGDVGGFAGYTGVDTSRWIAHDRMDLLGNHVAPWVALPFSFFDRRLVITPQLRFDAMTFKGYPGEKRSFSRADLLPEPRVTLRVEAHPRVSLRGAIGVYHQPPASADLSTVFGNPDLRPTMGIHYVAGIEIRPTPTLTVEAQGFLKQLRHLVVRGTEPGEPYLINDGEGRIIGGELLVRQQIWRNFFGWLSYTISRSERRSLLDGSWRPFQYDQTHMLTLVASYKLPRGFQLGLRFRFASGSPYTPAARAYYDANSDGYAPIWGALYSARLPDFHQLDLRLDKEFVFDRWKFLVYIDVQNLYWRENAETSMFSYDYRKLAFVNSLPFLPSLGLRGEF